MMLPTRQDYIRQSFAHRSLAGAPGLSHAARGVAGLSAYTDPSTGLVYGGYQETGGGPDQMPNPQLYAAEDCGPTDYACVSRNSARQSANMALLENARRAYNLQICQANAALNPGTAQDQPCTQFVERVPVPPAPGGSVLQTAVCTSGECYTPILGDTGQVNTQQAKAYAQYYTPQGVPKQTTQVVTTPNQTVAPNPQPGEVPTNAGGPAPVAGSGGGLFGGFDTKTLLIGGAVLAGVLMLSMRGKG